jgi:hypothetical protein
MEKILIISPQAGMGNRFRALSGAMLLGEQLGRKVYHAWFPTKVNDERPSVAALQAVGFDKFFVQTSVLPLANNKIIPKVDLCISEQTPDTYWYYSQTSGLRHWNASSITHKKVSLVADYIAKSKADVILLETSHRVQLSPKLGGYKSMLEFYFNINRHYKTLLPQPYYLDIVNKEVESNVGVTIRRGDLLYYSERSRQNILDLKNWIGYLAENNVVSIFSDDKELRKDFLDNIKGQINRCENLKLDTFSDIESAYLQFLYLTNKVNLITGTPDSTFAVEASIFGGVPFAYNLTPPPPIGV